MPARRALPLSLRASVEAVERISATEFLVSAYPFDPAQPSRGMRIALFCGGRLVALEKPRRLRRDLVGQPGFEAVGGRRIGYRMRIPTAVCGSKNVFAVVVDETGLMAVRSVPQVAP